MRALWISLTCAGLAFLTLGSMARAGSSEDCLACHSDPSLSTDRKGKSVSLHVDPATLAGSVHKDLGCTDCHAGFNAEELLYKKKIDAVACADCHSDTAEKHPFHAGLATPAPGKAALPSCRQCHGSHDVVPVRSEKFRYSTDHPVESCGACHRQVARTFAASAHGKALETQAKGAPGCLSCHNHPLTKGGWKGDEASLKIAQEKVCLSCHLDDPNVKARMGPRAGFIAAYEKSVHGAALLAGNSAAANCVDCHGSHEMRQGMDPEARVNKSHIPETCAKCHAAEAEKYGESIHAAAVRRGNPDAPVCTDCHGEHDILFHSDPRSPVAARNVSSQVCSPCHSSVKLSEKYGIPSDRARTFADSFHGLAIRGGGTVEVANCASCHGAHDIKASAEPTSSVNKANLAVTCGRCHPGANWRFTVGAVHVTSEQAKEPILYWIATLYVGLIVLVVGGMFLHNLLDFIRKSSHRLRVRRGETLEEHPGHSLYLRMTLGERLQHGALMLSFTVLVITGFMLRYPEAWWVQGIRHLSDHAFEARSLSHRIAALVMIAASAAHLTYLAFTRRGREFFRDMLPCRRDVSDARQNLLHNLGLSANKPRFGRFSYMEKMEYWALVWGTLVMALTGVIMAFENLFISLLTKLGWDISRTVHFYEAWLATLAILVWHLYYVIFNPEVYPMNTAWISGQMPESVMAEEHPRELEELRRREQGSKKLEED
jgi:cytochrome b subunit of formate dehydrogenase